ncbi:MAG TPA: DUF1326 domain-containing protein [Vicinamibacterales bacterium]|nr:DUF1326 domain-containing protein [Vicinamibacterales bacterium]
MKRAIVLLSVFGLASTVSIAAGGRGAVSGQYVEARTAEVFTGGCIMGSEAETMGKQAVLAWRIDRGAVNGVSVDGLSVVAALAGDVNLGLHEIGGGTANVRSVVYVDERATPVQRLALVTLAHDITKRIGTIVQVQPAPITFADAGETIHVATTNVALDVNKQMTHDPTCGAQQWFHPLANVDRENMGTTDQNAYTGTSLGTKWSDPNKRSAFFGTFSY